MTHIIDNFRGPYRWLSNFEMVEVTMPDGITYPSTEHAFQAHKILDLKARRNIAALPSPREAKKLGRHLKLREDWEEVKFDVMLTALRLKFKYPHLREKLLATGRSQLVEGNTWGDRVWGVCDGEGENHLGRLLMQVRDELRGALPKFFRVLDVSTCHITLEDNQRLEDGEAPIPTYSTNYGFIVYSEHDRDEWEQTDFSSMSEAFAKVMEWARDIGADYVWFDRDGATYSNLETFEW